MTKFIFLILGGATGTILRYFCSGWSSQFLGAQFPYGTLIVNLLGCFIIGFVLALPQNKFPVSEEMRLLIVVGFCGAFTTFSTWICETDKLIQKGEITKVFLNIVVSLILGYLIYRLGVLLARLV
jgi:CrcB protein